MDTIENILIRTRNVLVIDSTINIDEYISIDLSVSNTELQAQNFENANQLEMFIKKYKETRNAKVAYGGYNERRNLYKRSDLFNDIANAERNIHIGIDLWIDAGTWILAALDGKVHSCKNNYGLGNYGPTIILQHQIEGHVFYTLYGHLSLVSIEKIQIGQTFKRGAFLATLGSAEENGDYAPHLHFQIIKDIQDYNGDYPGVCAESNLDFYLQNCPDPNLLLKLN